MGALAVVLATSLAAAQSPLRVGEDVPAPTRLKAVPPVYPEPARSEWIQGVVVLDVTVDPGGNVADVTVIRSIPALDEAAVAAVRQWEYAPTVYEGQPVSVVTTTSLNFTLPGAAEWVVQPDGEAAVQLEDYVLAIHPNGKRSYRGSVLNLTDQSIAGLRAAVWYEEFIPALVETDGRPGDVEPMKKVDAPPPEYPSAARANGIQGVVRAQLFVDAEGTVERLRILRSIPALDPAVTSALRQWVYTPATYLGEPVAFVAHVEVNFGDVGVSIASDSVASRDIGRALKTIGVELETLDPGAGTTFALDLELSPGFDVKSPELVVEAMEDGRVQRVPTRRQKKTVPAR